MWTVPQLCTLCTWLLWRHVYCSKASAGVSWKPSLLCLTCFLAPYLSLQCWRPYFLGRWNQLHKQVCLRRWMKQFNPKLYVIISDWAVSSYAVIVCCLLLIINVYDTYYALELVPVVLCIAIINILFELSETFVVIVLSDHLIHDDQYHCKPIVCSQCKQFSWLHFLQYKINGIESGIVRRSLWMWYHLYLRAYLNQYYSIEASEPKCLLQDLIIPQRMI